MDAPRVLQSIYMTQNEFHELDDPKNKNRIERWEGLGAPAIEADLVKNSGISFVGAPERHALAWIWLKFKKAQPAS
ncbi:MAG: hypothetical protein K0R10_1613 [Alphaproteobacteria bacterium]|jgi:hypothetical protein|nr:hypothetical protein [Alphaproteobacteria bacterium]